MSAEATKAPRWSTQTDRLDWLIVAIVSLLSAVTLWLGSSLVAGPWDSIFASVAWALAGAGWAVAVALRTTDRLAGFIAIGLGLAALASLLTFGPLTAVIFLSPFLDPAAVVAAAAIVVGALFLLVLVRQRPSRLVWLIAPVVTAVSFGLVISDIPRQLRFTIAEPYLATFVEQARAGTATRPTEDEPVDFGGVPVYEVIIDDGQVRLVTGYVGILGEDEAGLAYVDEGFPQHVGRFDHLRGHWYRWYPY